MNIKDRWDRVAEKLAEEYPDLDPQLILRVFVLGALAANAELLGAFLEDLSAAAAPGQHSALERVSTAISNLAWEGTTLQ